MDYRKSIDTTDELAAWYDEKYREMGGCWVTPAEECNRHLDRLGVPFDKDWLLLDVGCGGGHFLEQADKRVTCHGAEISDVAIEECAKRFDGLLYKESIESGVWGSLAGQYDFIVSIGSLEHVVDLGKALDNIKMLLAPRGWWYFYCPNELWLHEDQPNERTMTDEEWIALFSKHGLATKHYERINDNTAFQGTK